MDNWFLDNLEIIFGATVTFCIILLMILFIVSFFNHLDEITRLEKICNEKGGVYIQKIYQCVPANSIIKLE